MTNREKREIAKDIVAEAIGIAYYRLDDGTYDELSENDKQEINNFIIQYGTAACKAIRREYIGY